MAEEIAVENISVCLRRYIKDQQPVESDMEIVKSEVTLRLSEGTQDVLVQNLYLSPDPYMRNRMREIFTSYLPPFEPGKPIAGFGVAKVILSDHPDFQIGDIVTGIVSWEKYSVIKGGLGLRNVSHIDVPLSFHIGILGLPGLTAYAGFFEVCKPKKGEQVFVSAASGAVGQLVGQLAKLAGCRVVGSAGTDEKVELLMTRLGYDDGFNYKKEANLSEALKRYFPEGIDIYFENVGGKMLEAVLDNLKVHARIAVCGMISQNLSEHGEGIRNLSQLIVKRAKMQGFLMTDYLHLQEEFTKFMLSHLKEKKIIFIEDVVDGIENAPHAFIRLLQGKNIGKQIVHL
ncbi:hypothetical protein KP509_22G010700 [Ceratopteris richardii]|uniref:Enoyl reductase (ER) domain-containing protein n=1 Tax=Ceratopteris richardii TaxID=49495 RepID=A0A8T2S5C2_CERRI|nr:hypothetical protein KP509_22G010700 [Ceratopteris richardii]